MANKACNDERPEYIVSRATAKKVLSHSQCCPNLIDTENEQREEMLEGKRSSGLLR